MRPFPLFSLMGLGLLLTACNGAHEIRTDTPAPPVAIRDPLFTNMTITFSTTGDDKDADTRVEVWINKAGESEAAYVDVPREYFADRSVRIFDVAAKSNPMRLSEAPGSWIQIKIAPHAHDMWKFKFHAVLRFDDGSTVTKDVENITLNEDARQGRYPLP